MSDSVRAAPKNIDARALRTRQLLAEALMSLGAARGVDDLDVCELVEEAGVARSTFYAHYAGKDDFLVRSFVNMIAATEAARERYPEREDLLPSWSLFQHVYEARDFARRAARAEVFPAQMAAGEAKLREIVEANLARVKPEWTRDRRRETAVYVAAGFIGLLRWWMESGLKKTPDEMQAAFVRLTKTAMEANVGCYPSAV
jgi:AcrR family transcriptional regulator